MGISPEDMLQDPSIFVHLSIIEQLLPSTPIASSPFWISAHNVLYACLHLEQYG